MVLRKQSIELAMRFIIRYKLHNLISNLFRVAPMKNNCLNISSSSQVLPLK